MLTYKQISDAAVDRSEFTHGKTPTEGRVHFRVGFIDGVDWAQTETKTKFLSFIQSTELSQKDKDLIKGVFYGWLKEDGPG